VLTPHHYDIKADIQAFHIVVIVIIIVTGDMIKMLQSASICYLGDILRKNYFL